MNEWDKVRPIRANSNEVFNFENREFYHVGRAVAAILADPHAFTFSTIAAESIWPTLIGHGNINMSHVASISWDDAQRPLLFITYPNNIVRLIDGHHRALRAIRDCGAPFLGAWTLTTAQTKSFVLTKLQADSLPKV